LPKRFDELDKSIFLVKEKITQFERKVESELKELKTEINVIYQSNAELKKQNKIIFYFTVAIILVSISTLIYVWMKL
jgi:hypothetical protein